MYLEETKELADGMNHLEIRLGDHGYVQVDRTWHSEQVCSPFSRLYLVRRGEGLLRVGGNSLTMRPGFAYWIPAGLCFDYLCENTMEKLFFHVQALKPDGYDLLMGMGRVETRPLPAGELDRLLALYRRRDYGAALLLKAAITALTADMAQSGALEEQVIRDYSPAVADTIRYIRRHLSLQLSVRELAGRLYLTPNALGRQFRQETGLTIGRYIDDLLFFSAQAQLIRSDKTIREISDALGFCDPFYFSRRFKQRYGQTPGAYRRLQEANGRLYRQSSDSSAPASAPTQPAAKP